MLIASAILITLALVFYSVGVWSERIARYLKQWHVAAFWTGFLFDVSGTLAMHLMAETKSRISGVVLKVRAQKGHRVRKVH